MRCARQIDARERGGLEDTIQKKSRSQLEVASFCGFRLNQFRQQRFNCSLFFVVFFSLSVLQLLKHHVVPGTVPSSALQNNAVSQSLVGTPLRVKFYESEDAEWRPMKVKHFVDELPGCRVEARLPN